MWTSNLSFENGNYFGTINAWPELTTEANRGVRIKITKENLSD